MRDGYAPEGTHRLNPRLATDSDSESESDSDSDNDSDDDSDSGSDGDSDSDDDSDDDSDSGSDGDRYMVLERDSYYSDSESDSDCDSDPTSIRLFPEHPLPTSQHKKAQHKAWLPFAEFLGQIPGLKALVYTCAGQLPRCVLDALHRHQPRSRLHVRAFSLRSLYQDRSQQHDMDGDELALATSPCLYSIHISFKPYDRDGHFSFNLDAVKHMVSGHAPNLRRVHIRMLYFDPRYAPPSHGSPRVAWKGFPRPASDQPSPEPTQPSLARLETLTLSGALSGPEQLSSWNARTDFSCLRRFELNLRLSPEGFNTLALCHPHELPPSPKSSRRAEPPPGWRDRSHPGPSEAWNVSPLSQAVPFCGLSLGRPAKICAGRGRWRR